MQEDLDDGQARHEMTGPVLPSEFVNRLGHICRQVESSEGATVGLDGRALGIGG